MESATARLVGRIANAPHLTKTYQVPLLCRLEIEVDSQVFAAVATGELAEACCAMQRGMIVEVEGRLELHRWKTGNTKCESVTIHVKNCRNL